jgi:4'-phosphopantetheinyl transferase
MNVKNPGREVLRDEERANGLITLTLPEVHLWLAFISDSAGEQLHSAYRELLSAEERDQEKRFFFKRDQDRYLVTRALVRTVLSHYVNIHPREWIFVADAYGRPSIVNVRARQDCLSFNVSHTSGLIVLGVAKGRALGVDVENFAARTVPIEIANRFFAPQEAAALAATPSNQQNYRFFEYWTFKEAYIKARGLGLSLPLDKFTFHFPSESAVEIEVHADMQDTAARWQFWQLSPVPECLLAVCAERADTIEPTTLTVRTSIPLLIQTPFPAEFLRMSY